MNTKDNQRSRLTKMLFKQSYLTLMKEKPTGKITVKELCERSEVNRSTFYLHYSEPNDVLIELEDEAIAGVKESLCAIGGLNEDSDSAKKYLMSFLRYVQQHGEIFRTFLIENSDPHFRKKLQKVALEMTSSAFRVEMPPELSRTVYLFIVSGSIEVLSDWVLSDFTMPEKDVCSLLYRMCEGGIRQICFPER